MLDLTTCLFFFADFKAESRCTDAENTVQKLQKEVDKLEGKHDSEPPFPCHSSVKSVPIMKFSLYFFLSVTISRAVFMYLSLCISCQILSHVILRCLIDYVFPLYSAWQYNACHPILPHD